MIGERVASVSAARARQGRWHGPAPYGYRSGGKDGLVVEPTEAAIVRRMFREYALEGRSQRVIGRGLNRDGILGQRGGDWEQGVLSKLLANPAYVGCVRSNGEEYPGAHEPLIGEDLWRKAAQLRASNTRSDGGARRKGKAPVANHLLAGGLLRCGRCGSPMGAETKPTRTPGVLYERYVCTSKRRHGVGKCEQPRLKRQPIDEAIWRFVTDTALDLDATRRLLAEQTNAKLAELDAHRQHATTDAQRARERLTRVKRDYQDGRLDPDDWREQRDELTAELDAATALVHQLDAQHQLLVAAAAQTDAESRVLVELAAIRAAIMGEARDGASAGVAAFRTALRRVFLGFELVPNGTWPVASGLGGVIWPQNDEHPELNLVDGYQLWPHVRVDALEWDPTKPWAPRPTTLALSASDTDTRSAASNGIQRSKTALSALDAIGLLM